MVVLTGPDHGHVQHDFLIKAGVLICRRRSVTFGDRSGKRSRPVVADDRMLDLAGVHYLRCACPGGQWLLGQEHAAVVVALDRDDFTHRARRHWPVDVWVLLGTRFRGFVLDRHVEAFAVGTLTLVTFPIPTGLRAWTEDVVVDEAGRGRGVGAALVREAIRLASAAGARTVDLTSRPSRTAANRLYEGLGFRVRDSKVYRLTELMEPANTTTP